MKLKYFEIAEREAAKNPSRFKMAAVFVPRSGNEFYIGRNSSYRSHPISTTIFNDMHAELSALIKFGLWNKEGIKGGEMYVLRLAEYGISNARPCKHCETLLYNFGIKKCHYTTKTGIETFKPLDKSKEL